MKLQAHEIYAIEKYLLEQDLISLEFYNEMLDHFINAIVDYKSKGNDFDKSFILTKETFEYLEYSNWFQISSYSGVKALELKRYDKIKRYYRSTRFWSPINLLKRKEGIPWIIGFSLLLAYGFQFGGKGLFSFLAIGFLMVGIKFVIFSIKADIIEPVFYQKRWLRYRVSSLTERKGVQLKPNYRLLLLLKIIQNSSVAVVGFSFISVQHLTNEIEPFGWNNFTFRIVLAYLFLLITVDNWMFFKKEYDKINLEKA